MDAHLLIILFALLIIVSYFFNVIAKKTNIPSVLLLIALGIGMQPLIKLSDFKNMNLDGILEVLGQIGLIMIVLEAALELELSKKKLPLIFKSIGVALISLVGTSFAIAYIGLLFFDTDLYHALLYAIPIATMSSAIVLPSVINLDEDNKEFMIYESTFSDIIGIMFFYFLLDADAGAKVSDIVYHDIGNITLTIIVSVVSSLTLAFVFQKIKSKVKLFLLIAVLVLLYSVGKKLHLSSLLIILVFGLTVNNSRLLNRGFMKKYFDQDILKSMLGNLQLLTFESSFIIRTFFFVIFGLSITISSIYDPKILLISFSFVAAIYLVRFLILLVFKNKSILPVLFISPRGLITILLFFAIPVEYEIVGFRKGILLVIILVTCITMAIALIRDSRLKKLSLHIDDENRVKTDFMLVDNSNLSLDEAAIDNIQNQNEEIVSESQKPIAQLDLKEDVENRRDEETDLENDITNKKDDWWITPE